MDILDNLLYLLLDILSNILSLIPIASLLVVGFYIYNIRNFLGEGRKSSKKIILTSLIFISLVELFFTIYGNLTIGISNTTLSNVYIKWEIQTE